MSSTKVDALLQQFECVDDLAAIDTLRAIIDWLRPPAGGSSAAVLGRIEELALALEARAALRERLFKVLAAWVATARHLGIYTEIGLFSRRGFVKECLHRVYERLNPAALDAQDLKDAFALVFHDADDSRWVRALPEDAWLRLFDAVVGDAGNGQEAVRQARNELLYAIEMLALWIAAEELDPDLQRLDPRLTARDSAFVAQQRELAAFVRDYARWIEGDSPEFHDDAHARVLLAQCGEQVERLRKRAVQRGSTVGLTYLLERLEQTLDRIATLLTLLDPAERERSRATAVGLFKALVTATVRRHDIAALWHESVGLVSRSVSEHASRTGEHYITHNRAEYLHMLRAAGGAGCIIAVMALIKIQIVALGLSAGHATVWICLNYGFGFVLIHVLHFTVATKQPAMTAAHLAAAIEKGDRGAADLRKLADLLIAVGRSQFAAVLGNVALALPLAALIGWIIGTWTDTPLLPPPVASYQLEALHPFSGGALLYAAIAGVWLFVAGLIAGYFDNRGACLDLSARLRAHPLLRRRLSDSRRERLAAYIDANYGALVGNFCFGVLLGVTGYLGFVTGLPLDIRHVAFSSANLGFVLPGHYLDWMSAVGYLVLVILIGAVNLWVSFALALYVALSARAAELGSLRMLLELYVERIRARPAELILPPPSATDKATATADD